MMSNQYAFMIIGGGSIGLRHARNLSTLGQRVLYLAEPNPAQAASVHAEGFSVCESIPEGITPEVDAVLVCSPTVFHLEHVRLAVQADKHVFIEKPLSHTWDGVEAVVAEAQARGLVTLMGYNMRFRDGYRRAKALLVDGTLGNPLAARALVSFYLPHYHPGSDYRRRYQAQRALGGGVVLDDSHEIDYLLDLFGPVDEVVAYTERLSALEMDVEDYAGALLKHRSGVITQLQMDFLGRVYRRELDITGSAGTLTLDHNSGEIRLYGPGPAGYRVLPQAMSVTLNAMYLDEMQHFIDCLNGQATSVADIASGAEVLRVALAMFESAQTGSIVRL
ncbi:MAG: Gfo/Idh/MocA family protein [Anaerolineales bacterium]